MLKRCLGQQGEVRLTLYQTIIEVVTKNPELCAGAGGQPRLVSLRGGGGQAQVVAGQVGEGGGGGLGPGGACWSLLEPVGWFLNCVQMLVGKGQPVVGEEF